MLLETLVNGVKVQIDLPGVSEDAYWRTSKLLKSQLSDSSIKNRETISAGFRYLLQECPTANASDLWHHVLYRLYCSILPTYRPTLIPSQSWVRASGDALEMFLEQWYSTVLLPHGIRIKMLIGSAKRNALVEMGIASSVGAAKLDMTLHLEIRKKIWLIFGGVHVKASLAERVSDDIPASRAMMEAGYFSPLWTLDVKSFPPPHGDLINRGELGSPVTPSEKRRYIESHGDFHACYSANSRTIPSLSATPSGKRIYAIRLSDQLDQFAKDVIHWAANKRLLQGKR